MTRPERRSIDRSAFAVVAVVAILAVVALTLAGCGSSRSNSSHARTTAPTASPTSTTPTASPTSTAANSPTTSPTVRAAGGPVPAGTRATSVTFISPRTALVLGTAPCRRPPCSVILRTPDRGRSWVGLPAPLEPVSARLGNGLWGLRFADSSHGYAYGNGFWETSNGAAGWRRGGGPARIVAALEAVQDRELVAIAAPCLPGQASCRDVLGIYRRAVAGGPWTVVAATRTIPFEASIAVHGARVWALAGARLYVSADGGATFALHPQPCWPAHPRNGMATAVTDDGPHVYLLCTGSGGAGSIEKLVFRASPSSPGWTRVASPPLEGGPQGLSAGSDSAIVVAAASGASELYRSADAGSSWRTAVVREDGGAGWADLGFTTATDGVVIHGPPVGGGTSQGGPGEVLLTDNGGRSWHAVTF